LLIAYGNIDTYWLECDFLINFFDA
jgi:hypothetical protein